jgi:hypothetical protein
LFGSDFDENDVKCDHGDEIPSNFGHRLADSSDQQDPVDDETIPTCEEIDYDMSLSGVLFNFFVGIIRMFVFLPTLYHLFYAIPRQNGYNNSEKYRVFRLPFHYLWKF